MHTAIIEYIRRLSINYKITNKTDSDGVYSILLEANDSILIRLFPDGVLLTKISHLKEYKYTNNKIYLSDPLFFDKIAELID